jgi:hypothetical protein
MLPLYTDLVFGVAVMKNESVFPQIMEHQRQLMNKELKRVSEFSRFLPFADQQRES